MFHFLVKYNGWGQSSDSIGSSRVFENTQDRISQNFRSNETFELTRISSIPALFASESGGSGKQVARVGRIDNVGTSRSQINLNYTIDSSVPPIPILKVEQLLAQLGIDEFELSRTHWAIKDVDLFKVLFLNRLVDIPTPKVFSVDDAQAPENTLIAAMMAFSSEFDKVYLVLQQMSGALNLRCLRADDIWENDVVIQDIVSLICRSRIVICDCTDRNANVFYEAGIAHSLGKDVILITQSENDIPFNLRHLRYLHYLNNDEGRERLSLELSKRICTILASATC